MQMSAYYNKRLIYLGGNSMPIDNNIRELTQEGMQKAKDRLDYLITVRRREVADQIAVARGFGDLSENAEYDEARNEQGKLEAEISDLEEYIRSAVVVDTSSMNIDIVSVGSTVTIYCDEMGGEYTWDIVGARESDPDSSMISSESPIGKALNGKSKGDKVTVNVPNGDYILEIKKVERTKR